MDAQDAGFSNARIAVVVLVVVLVSASALVVLFALPSTTPETSSSISTGSFTTVPTTSITQSNTTSASSGTNTFSTSSSGGIVFSSSTQTNNSSGGGSSTSAQSTSSTVATSSLSTTNTSASANPLCALSPCAPIITGWLHTNPGSTSVYDSRGTIVPLEGVDVDGLDFGNGNPSTSPDSCGKGWSIPPTSFGEVASWGFNSVRIPISWENLEPTAPTLAANGTWVHHWSTAYLEELDSVVSRFGQNHIAVIFDFAQVDVSSAFQQAPFGQGGECEGWGNPTWLYPSITSPTSAQELATAMCNFFNDRPMVSNNSAPPPVQGMEDVEQMLASRYTNNPTVIGIDIFNEPWFNSGCGSTASEANLLTNFYTQMGEAIAKANPHLLLIFEDSPPGLMSGAPILASPPSVANAIYEFHIYTSNWQTAQPYVQAFLDKARGWEIPIWMGEFDAFEAGCTGSSCKADPNWQADTQALLSFCNENGINWAYFSYYSLGTNVQTPVAHAAILAVLRGEIVT